MRCGEELPEVAGRWRRSDQLGPLAPSIPESLALSSSVSKHHPSPEVPSYSFPRQREIQLIATTHHLHTLSAQWPSLSHCADTPPISPSTAADCEPRQNSSGVPKKHDARPQPHHNPASTQPANTCTPAEHHRPATLHPSRDESTRSHRQRDLLLLAPHRPPLRGYDHSRVISPLYLNIRVRTQTPYASQNDSGQRARARSSERARIPEPLRSSFHFR